MSGVCPKILDMMLNYERLTEDQRLLVDEHTIHCSDCCEELVMVKEVGVIFGDDDVVVPENFADRVMSNIEQPVERDRSVPVFWWLGGLVAAQIAAAIILHVGVLRVLTDVQLWFSALDFRALAGGVVEWLSSLWTMGKSVSIPAVPASISLVTIMGGVVVVLLFAGVLIYHERSSHVE